MDCDQVSACTRLTCLSNNCSALILLYPGLSLFRWLSSQVVSTVFYPSLLVHLTYSSAGHAYSASMLAFLVQFEVLSKLGLATWPVALLFAVVSQQHDELCLYSCRLLRTLCSRSSA